jgi:D-alanine-D-alanine ligase
MGPRRVGVLYGGWGEEKGVSTRTGDAIAGALERRGHEVCRIPAGPRLDVELRGRGVEVAFLALHGRMGEDGRVQGLLEVLGIPYTGSGVLASAVAMDKGVAKKLFRQHNLATPAGYLVARDELDQLDDLHLDLGFPCVVKPSRGGSSVGLTLVESMAALAPAVANACRYGGEALVERYVKGREVTVALLGGEVLGCCEVSHQGALFDTQAKYEGGARLHQPPRLPPTRIANLEALALNAWHALGCRGAARVDFLCPEVGNEVVLEVNSLPGMTATSLLPRIAAHQGLAFEDLCERILALAQLDESEPLPLVSAPVLQAPAL